MGIEKRKDEEGWAYSRGPRITTIKGGGIEKRAVRVLLRNELEQTTRKKRRHCAMLRRLASVSRLERNAPTDGASDLQGARELFFEDGRRMNRASAARDLAGGSYARIRARRRGLDPYSAQVRATIFYARSWKDVTLGFCRARLRYHARLCRGSTRGRHTEGGVCSTGMMITP